MHKQKTRFHVELQLAGNHCSETNFRLSRCGDLRPDLNIKVHQLGLLEQQVDAPGLQPAQSLLLPAAQVNEDPQAALGQVQSRPVGPGNAQAEVTHTHRGNNCAP